MKTMIILLAGFSTVACASHGITTKSPEAQVRDESAWASPEDAEFQMPTKASSAKVAASDEPAPTQGKMAPRMFSHGKSGSLVTLTTKR